MSPRAFVIGHPIKHSRSPIIHNHWLKVHGLPGHYEKIDVAPEALADFLRGMEASGFVGGNVTIPHKEAVMALCDEVSETARALGAVNTLWRRDGRLHGDNTDGLGFVANLDQSAPGWDRTGCDVLVLGAGGASRGILYSLLQRPEVARICVANRTLARAEELARLFGPRVVALPWEEAQAAIRAADVIINTTSLGMAGQPPLELTMEGARPHAVVADIVYVPLETPILARARAQGLRTVDGLGMLLHQAVPGFARWFGTTPTVTEELRALVVADIDATP